MDSPRNASTSAFRFARSRLENSPWPFGPAARSAFPGWNQPRLLCAGSADWGGLSATSEDAQDWITDAGEIGPVNIGGIRALSSDCPETKAGELGAVSGLC